MPRWLWLWIGFLVVLVVVPAFHVALPAVLLLFVLAYAVGFGRGRPRLAGRRSADSSLFEPDDRRRTDLRAMGGLVAAMVATADLAGFVGSGATGRWIALAALIGAAAAIGGPFGWLRSGIYLLLGIAASVGALNEVFVHGCDGAMPSRTAAWLVLVPLAAMVASRALLGPFTGRAIVPLQEAGSLALAGFAIIGLGAVAVAPAGIPVIDERSSSLVPLALLALLTIIAGLVGLRPRAGADLAAIGLLALSVSFAGYSPPCGPRLSGLLVIGVAFVVGFVLVVAVRART